MSEHVRILFGVNHENACSTCICKYGVHVILVVDNENPMNNEGLLTW